MAKFKVTKSNIKNSYYYIIGIGYCNAQYLLKGVEPLLYSSGVYGWSCDYYIIDDIVISTGYNYIEQNTNASYELIKKYENKASEIFHSKWESWEKTQKKLNNLLKRFIKEVLKNDNNNSKK